MSLHASQADTGVNFFKVDYLSFVVFHVLKISPFILMIVASII